MSVEYINSVLTLWRDRGYRVVSRCSERADIRSRRLTLGGSGSSSALSLLTGSGSAFLSDPDTDLTLSHAHLTEGMH